MNAAELEELAQDSGRADTGASGDTVVARLDAATRIREGSDAELWVDGRSMHVFDPATGRNLSLGADGGGAAGSSAARSSTGSGSAGSGGAGSGGAGSSAAGSSSAGSDAATGSTTPAGRRRGGHLIFRRSRSMTSSFHSWVMMSRYRSAATRM